MAVLDNDQHLRMPSPSHLASGSIVRRPVGSRWARRVAVAALVAGALLLAGKALLGGSSELLGAADLALHPDPAWLLTAVAVELCSYLAGAAGIRRLFGAGGRRFGLLWLTALNVSAQAAADVLPIGFAVQNVFLFRQFQRRGIEATLVMRTLLLNSALNLGALALIALLAAQVAAGVGGATDVQLGAALLLTIVLGATLAVVVLTRRRLWRPLLQRVPSALARRATGRVSPMTAADRLDVTPVEPLRWRSVAGAGGWLAVSWLADLACLAAAFFGIGIAPPWRVIALAYAAGQLVAVLPITPGGLGVVEGSLTFALVAYGGARQQTLAAVLLYRLVSYWGLLPTGLLCYLGLRKFPVKEGELA